MHKTALTAACYNGKMSIVKALLEAGADVNLKDKRSTPLIEACLGWNIDVVKVLINAGADVNLQGKSLTPLTAACRYERILVVKELVKSGADVNLQDGEDSPLTAACNYSYLRCSEEQDDVDVLNGSNTPLADIYNEKHVIVLKELLEAGANVNIQDWKGRTPLYIVVLRYDRTLIPVLKMLTNYGADATICNDEGLSPIYITLLRNESYILKQLLQTGCEGQLNSHKIHLFNCLVNIRHSDVMTNKKDDVVTRNRVWCIEESGDSHKTIIDRKCNILKNLISLGLDVNQRILLEKDYYEYDERPLLFLLIDENSVEDRKEKVGILLKAGVDVNIRVQYSDYDDEENDNYNDSLDLRFQLEKDCVSVLERTRQLLRKCRKRKDWCRSDERPTLKKLLSKLKKHVRRYSI
ncbi:serine/threonine-protein phosphatase 6 regulatory ankyrin repeat subunit A-like [Saccostrea cucullata]|uniref:serine/threonine-protein phosphatase 6 regulatory ankyrin repeat subunit A-like n=1 Tax=Saccostrea cuccullata TaxID=36930 RepID=UPI002ED58BFA